MRVDLISFYLVFSRFLYEAFEHAHEPVCNTKKGLMPVWPLLIPMAEYLCCVLKKNIIVIEN